MPTDDSPRAEAALERARRVPRSAITALHVVHPWKDTGAAFDRLRGEPPGYAVTHGCVQDHLEEPCGRRQTTTTGSTRDETDLAVREIVEYNTIENGFDRIGIASSSRR